MTNYGRIRVLVVGSSRVGKSAVTVRYLTKRFIGEYSSSADFLYKHTVVLDGGARTDIEILDTSKCSDPEGRAKFDGGCEEESYWRWPHPYPGHSATQGGVSVVRGEGGASEDEEDYDGGLRREYSPWRHAGEYEEDEERLMWGDAFVVVYSVCDRRSFGCARRLLAKLARLRGGICGGEEDGLAAPALLLGNKRDLDHAREIGVDAGQELSLRYGAQFYEVSAAQSYAGVSLAFQSLLREARSQRLLRTLSSSSPSSSSRSISSSSPPPFPSEHCLFASPPPPPTPLHRLLRSLSSSSSASSSSSCCSSFHPQQQHHFSPFHPFSPHPTHHRLEAASVLSALAAPPPSPSTLRRSSSSPPPPQSPLLRAKALPAHKRARLGMGNSVSKVLGTIFGKNGSSSETSTPLSGLGDRKAKKKRPSLSI